ncbi:PREDICTED: LOW QUALITY PROTEIN: prostaglandin E2 receptor EP2 subtype [Chrysochloris asiatica]|uniref:Prostaglandin E2 receptor EP2 subtype n=1 Tax=Chrysochloris asiatica TaxID=185453 RepID=A0A9B0WYZ2_CHRAS|nr:PREDICTED: LOW QUALITY PROTEIN: prostaglandin E2 receptor EP2 subtype [Chrysochloris asiatica]
MGNVSNDSPAEDCKTRQWLPLGESPAISSVMFSAGVLGNLIALALLVRRWRGDPGRSASLGNPISLFHVLVTELVFTDLLGTCFISPMVLASYARNQTLVALAHENRACNYFAFAMTFFSLATMLMLFAMALERYLSIGHPYFYQRHVTRHRGLAVLPAIYAISLLFCSLPLFGYVQYAQYCPGTWCFIHHEQTAYLQFYATLLLLLIVAVLVCNFSVFHNLVRMYRRGRRSRCAPTLGSGRSGPGTRRRGAKVSMAEETDHLILLAIMTITFAICSLPFTIFAYMSKTSSRQEKWDLQALRFLSINSIIDPWVFVILRPPVLRLMRSVLCCRVSLKTQDTIQTSCSTQSNSSNRLTFVDSN